MRFLPIAILLAVTAVPFPGVPGYAVSDPVFLEVRGVADASDRAYEPTAIWLLDRAQSSIVLSLYLLNAVDDPHHPIDRLVGDLLEARERQVAVTVYLNTRIRGVIRGIDPSALAKAPWITRLTAAGARIVLIRPARMLHDKLLIVDERYVLEGSTNWTIGALRSNWESNTLIDSPELARIKLERLRQREHLQEAPAEADLPESVDLPMAILERGGVLTRLAVAADERAFDAYLLLLREAATIKAEGAFFISLESLGDNLNLPADWDDTTARRQVIKVLRKLSRQYKALEIRFTHGADAQIALLAPPSAPVLNVPIAIINQTSSSQENSAVSYVRLKRLALVEQGVDVESLSTRDWISMTGLHPVRLKAALKAAPFPEVPTSR